MKQKVVSLYDEEFDGSIHFQYDKKHTGITIELSDIFDNAVCGTFYKKDLLKKLKVIVKDLENSYE